MRKSSAVVEMAEVPPFSQSTPSEIAAILLSNWCTRNATFVWGAPGIGKSEVARWVAEQLGVAFIDLRATQLAQEDLRGLPHLVVENGVHAMHWSAPSVLPRNLDFDVISTLDDAEPRTIRFANPLAIPPTLTLRAVGEGVEGISPVKAVLVERGIDRFTAGIREIVGRDADGNDILGGWVTGKLHWTVTGMARAILALDELNSADESVLVTFYQLVQDRRVGEYVLPDDVMIVAMGNRETDYGTTFRMPVPLLNRFEHHGMVVDKPEWLAWAVRHAVHPLVLAYHEKFEDALCETDMARASEVKAFKSPRTWKMVSNVLHTCPDLPPHLLTRRIIGCIGAEEGSKFANFRDLIVQLPRTADILDGRVSRLTAGFETLAAEVGRFAVCIALVHNLCHALMASDRRIRQIYAGKPLTVLQGSPERLAWIAQADHVFAFLMANLEPEDCIVAFCTALNVYRLPVDARQRQLPVFIAKYGDRVPLDDALLAA